MTPTERRLILLAREHMNPGDFERFMYDAVTCSRRADGAPMPAFTNDPALSRQIADMWVDETPDSHSSFG